MKRQGWLIIIVCGVMTMALQVTSTAQDDLDDQMLTRIRNEGLGSSQVMDHASWLTDVYGPRLTGTPAIAQAVARNIVNKYGNSAVQRRERLLEKGWGWVFGAATCVALTAAIGCAATPGTSATVAAGGLRQERLAERRGMVERQIATRGVRDPRVLRAMRSVPRHQFVPDSLQRRAYDDSPLPIGHDQTISQPYIVAYMTEALRLPPNAKVLDVGTGSGYQAAVLAEVAREVFSIEVLPELADSAATKLEQLGYENIHIRQGDGCRGWPEEAPFDGIIVAAAPDHVPEALVDQLTVGARLVIPVGDASQTMTIVRKTAEGASLDTTFPVRFVPMTGEARERR